MNIYQFTKKNNDDFLIEIDADDIESSVNKLIEAIFCEVPFLEFRCFEIETVKEDVFTLKITMCIIPELNRMTDFELVFNVFEFNYAYFYA